LGTGREEEAGKGEVGVREREKEPKTKRGALLREQEEGTKMMEFTRGRSGLFSLFLP